MPLPPHISLHDCVSCVSVSACVCLLRQVYWQPERSIGCRGEEKVHTITHRCLFGTSWEQVQVDPVGDVTARRNARRKVTPCAHEISKLYMGKMVSSFQKTHLIHNNIQNPSKSHSFV